MNIALRLAMACFVIAAPTLLYLGLLRGLEKLRDDALLMRLAESDDVPKQVSAMAARNLEERPLREKRPVRADGRGSAGAGASGGTSASANASVNAGTNGRPSASEHLPESVACGSCGAPNMLGARYCGECLDELH